jgi:hypothetical protein
MELRRTLFSNGEIPLNSGHCVTVLLGDMIQISFLLPNEIIKPRELQISLISLK